MVRRQAQVHDRTDAHLTVPHHDLVLHGVDAKDRDLRLVDDRGEALDAVHAEVRDREGTAAQLFGRQLALAGLFGQFLDLGGDLRQTLLVRVRDVGHHQAVVQRHRDAHVDIVLVDDLVILDRAVEQRELRQGLGDELYQQVGIADLDFLRLELLAVALHLGHVDAQVEGDGRRGHVRVLHVLGDGLAHAAHGLDFLALGSRFAGRRLLAGLGDIAQEILRQDTAVGRLDVPEVDAEIVGDLLGQRACLDGRGRWGCYRRCEPEHVARNHHALIAGGGNRAQVKALFLRELLGVRGCGDVLAGGMNCARCSRGCLGCCRCRNCRSIGRCRGSRAGSVRDSLSRRAEPADQGLAGHRLSRRNQDLQQNAVLLGFDVVGQLIRLDREKDLALLYRVADVLLPLVYRALGHGKAKLRH